MVKWGTMEKQFMIFTDGGARGNPGPAAAAFVIKDEQSRVLAEKGIVIGRATNNVAEYTGVTEALKWFKDNIEICGKKPKCDFYLDSKLVVNQLNGLFKIKNAALRDLIIDVRKLEQEIGGEFFYRFVPREKNRRADFLVNKVLSECPPYLFTS